MLALIIICHFIQSWLLAFFSLTLAFGTGISIGTLVLEEKQLRRTPSMRSLALIAIAALVENFGYRQINLLFRLRGIWSYLRKETGWAAVQRNGFSRLSNTEAGEARAGFPIDRRQTPVAQRPDQPPVDAVGIELDRLAG